MFGKLEINVLILVSEKVCERIFEWNKFVFEIKSRNRLFF